MKPRRTVSSNCVLELEGGNEDNSLWATFSEGDGIPTIASTWEFTAEERERVANGENVELVVFGESHPPVLMRITNVPVGGHISREEVVERLRRAGNDKLADLFAEKAVDELRAEVETWNMPDDLRAEVLAFVTLLGASDIDDRQCRLCGVVKGDPHEPCEDCGKLDREPPDPL